ncbi:Plant cysteine oxidase 3 [Zea mays]|nr:Plant cysteine oxidase 3 [Zea mays]
MTVLSKILYGSMHVKSYDWIEPTVLASSQPARLAKLHTDDVRTAPCPTSILYPQSGGNLHCFTSVSSCAVLDVLAPPYNDDAGRICTYFHDYPFSSLCKLNPSLSSYCMLVLVERSLLWGLVRL